MVHKAKKFTNVKLVLLKGEDYGEYSANPSDYWDMADDKKFKEHNLVGTEHKEGGWHRETVIKRNPTKADLKKYYDG